MSYEVQPIGYLRSCFKEKFAIPRQPALAPAATAELTLIAPYNQAQSLAGLEQVSHVWLIFLFHQSLTDTPHLTVRPPRLGGNQSIGVFASRATHRPNNIGQSVVKLERINQHRLYFSGIDLLDGTPILDIKPYVPYSDAIPTAQNLIAPEPPSLIAVSFSTNALAQAQAHAKRLQQPIVALIEQCLAQDPKPAYQKPSPQRIYGALFWDLNVTWHYPTAHSIHVLSVELAHH
ncbi:tRNA (N6-threonylcarbamoyladenosine(37)-N6)-methyltransferase TrmO [Pseudomonas sp. F1_0610]|uniref:tRNA (N6-threonylcarbamoyladenosine(37)-N6)-methyltransferase TrmO n=1 Tax=Pseudomonas sp. F1_0610 TaxID=3114284 RepID=UPI0039C29F3E